MAAAKGNTYAAKDKVWAAAIRRVLERRSGRVDRLDELDRLAETLIDKGLEGDMTALKELGDRLDGKATQVIEGPGADGEHIVRGITISFVEPKASPLNPAPPGLTE